MELNDSQIFMKEAGTKHFLGLSYLVQSPGQNQTQATRVIASCFVVEVAEQWALIAAGHVINEIKRLRAQGFTYSDFKLIDGFAGHSFKFPIPFDFDLSAWVAIEGDANGTDHALTLLRSLFVQALHVGGIRPIGDNAWGSKPFTQYERWLLLGIPAKGVTPMTDKMSIKLALLPLAPADPPTGVANLVTEGRMFARILSDPSDQAVIKDVRGMSGGPVFGIKATAESIQYWVIGIQSSWIESKRIISFCPAPEFFVAVEKAIEQLRARTLRK